MKKLLDIGCGPGTISNISYYEKMKNTHTIYGIDFIKQHVQIMKNRFPQGTFIEGNAEKIPFSNKYFDTIIIRHVLEHVDNPQKVISEIKRVCKKDAKIFIAVPHEKLEKIMNVLTPHYMEKGHHHQRVFTPNMLENMLKKNRFDVVKSSTEKWPLFITTVLLALLSRFTKTVAMQEQSGVFMIKKTNYLKEKKFYWLYTNIWNTFELFNKLFFFLNFVIPFEHEVIAKKR